MLTALDREWTHLRTKRRVLARLAAWPVDGPLAEVIRTASSLDDVVIATQPAAAGVDRAAQTLRTLVAIAAHDDLAARIVLQRLLGGLVSASRRWLHDQRDTPVDHAIGAAWIAIRQFDPMRTTRHIAPALIADAMWIGFRCERRRKASTVEVPVPTGVLAQTPSEEYKLHAWQALAATLRAAERAGVDTAHIDTMRTITRTGSPHGAAHHFGVTTRTIRTRRTAAAREIRAVLGPDWADWSDPVVQAA